MFSVASSTALMATLFTDTGTLVAYALGAILAGAIALVGLGFAWRMLTRKITGKKF